MSENYRILAKYMLSVTICWFTWFVVIGLVFIIINLVFVVNDHIYIEDIRNKKQSC